MTSHIAGKGAYVLKPQTTDKQPFHKNIYLKNVDKKLKIRFVSKNLQFTFCK